MSLAIDRRPTTLADLAGNESLKKSVGAMLKRPMKDIPRAFLFYGLTGGGKTTLGGILANHFKCASNELYEVNSANFRGIETVRELEKDIRYLPSCGNVRMWIFNECHMWLAPAQNAMLDLIEKAPDHVYIILTTTDPHKLIAPLRKRCVEYEVLPLTDDEMFDMLVATVDDEKADVPDDILEKIISVSQGSCRNALQALEKVIDLDPKDMAAVAFQFTDSETTTKNLIDALLKAKPWKDVSVILKGLTDEPETVRYSVLNYCNAMLLDPRNAKTEKAIAFIMDCFKSNFYDSGRAGLTLACYEARLGNE